MATPIKCECGDHCFVALSKGYVALLDAVDARLICDGSPWAAIKLHTVYAMITRREDGRNVNHRLHRLIMSPPPGIQVDHKNHNGLDNRRSNLRLATKNENQWNRKKRALGTSKFRGVSWHNDRKSWRAVIMTNGKSKTIGRFKNEVAAALAYDAYAIELHGEFASLNFPTKMRQQHEGRWR